MVVKDLKRVNFDKFVQKLLKLKTAPSISTLTSSQLTEKSVTIGWTVANSPTKVRVSVNGATPQVFAGTSGELKVAKVSGENSVVVKVEALDSDALV